MAYDSLTVTVETEIVGATRKAGYYFVILFDYSPIFLLNFACLGNGLLMRFNATFNLNV